MIIRVTHRDLGTVARGRGRGRIYITGTTPERERTRAWMGPESYKSLRDAVREDGAVWCDVPLEQVVKPRRTHQDARATTGGTQILSKPQLPAKGNPEGLETADPGEDEGDAGTIVEVAVYDENFLTGEKAAGFKDFESAAWGAGDIATLVATLADYDEYEIDGVRWSGTDPKNPRDVEGIVLATSTWELTPGGGNPDGSDSGVDYLLRIGPSYVVCQYGGGETIRDDWDAPNDHDAVEKFKVGFGPMPQALGPSARPGKERARRAAT